MPAERLRVLVADDHPMFRRGLRATIDSMDGVEVAAEAATGTQAVRAARELRPDLIVMDLHLPELDGIQATRRILDHNPTVAVLVLTMLEDHDSVFAAMQAGARGYLLKGADHDDITRAVRGVAHGEVIFGPAVAGQVLAFFSSARPAPPSPAFPELTDREREVLELLAGGHSNAAIATRLFLSPKTIRNYVSGIFTKLHVASRAEAIVRARDQGLGGGTTSQG